MWAWDESKVSLQKQHDSGWVSAAPRPVNWALSPACASALGVSRVEREREAVFITRAAQTTGGYFHNSSLCGCLAEATFLGKTQIHTLLLTLRKPRLDRPPSPARHNIHILVNDRMYVFIDLLIHEMLRQSPLATFQASNGLGRLI